MVPTLRSAALLALALLALAVMAQAAGAQPPAGQVVRGIVVDADTQAPLAGATVTVDGSAPLLGTSSDAAGRFAFDGVPLGRHALEVRYVGYEPLLLPSVLVRAGQETLVEARLRERPVQVGEAVVQGARDGEPVNDLALVSVRSFSVEETRRYAGSVDDPARLATAFGGVAPVGTGVETNAVVIRGNAPAGVLWRVEGVDVPTPSHFGGLSVAGGGGVTLFSGQVLAGSDVFTGAFPAEYGDALGGVFDVRFRSGNPSVREHTAQVGLLGVEAASEGPFRRGTPSTYLVNYRYSTLGLLAPVLPTDGRTTFQDLSFKAAFPTRTAGRFEVWGLGGLDGQRYDAEPDRAAWTSDADRERFDLSMGVGAVGVTHHLTRGRTLLRTRAAATVAHASWNQDRLDDAFVLRPDQSVRRTDARLHLGTTLTHKLSPQLLAEAGVSAQRVGYDLDVQVADRPGLISVAQDGGASALVQGFAQSRFAVAPRLTLTGGAHVLHVALTGATAVEPRLGLAWAVTDRQSVRVGYGLHSQAEAPRIYLARLPDGRVPNRDLGLTRAHHLVAGTTRQLSPSLRVGVEAYAQRLFDVPVVAGTSASLLNLERDVAFADPLVNAGAGENVGVEVTAERPFRDGSYALLTGSLSRSRYRGGDGVWRPTRYDRGAAVALLAGREVRVGTRSLLSANVRLSALGGERRSPVDEAASAGRGETVYDEARAFEERAPAVGVVDLTVTLRVDGRSASHVVALQLKNALAARTSAVRYDSVQGGVVDLGEGFALPVLSYKVEL